MPPLTFRAFLSGPDTWRPRSPWHPFLALIVAALVLAIGQLAPIVAIIAMRRRAAAGDQPMPVDDPGFFQMSDEQGTALLVLSQAVLAMLTFTAARLRHANPSEALSLGPPPSGARNFVYALVLLVPLLAAVNAAAYLLNPTGFQSDFEQFMGLARGENAVGSFLAIAIGAPMWEELLFRGFLLASFAAAIGFWPAAGLVSAGWSALHFGYSATGIAEVFLIGLYFAWLLRRTGSLWVPIACHAIYNGCLFLAMRFLPI